MDLKALQRIVDAGESETVEFKKSTAQLSRAGETLACASGRDILHVLAGHRELPLRGLRERLAHQAADRTIQEDLAHLRRLGWVEAAGRGRGARYRLRRTRDE